MILSLNSNNYRVSLFLTLNLHFPFCLETFFVTCQKPATVFQVTSITTLSNHIQKSDSNVPRYFEELKTSHFLWHLRQSNSGQDKVSVINGFQGIVLIGLSEITRYPYKIKVAPQSFRSYNLSHAMLHIESQFSLVFFLPIH